MSFTRSQVVSKPVERTSFCAVEHKIWCFEEYTWCLEMITSIRILQYSIMIKQKICSIRKSNEFVVDTLMEKCVILELDSIWHYSTFSLIFSLYKRVCHGFEATWVNDTFFIVGWTIIKIINRLYTNIQQIRIQTYTDIKNEKDFNINSNMSQKIKN